MLQLLLVPLLVAVLFFFGRALVQVLGSPWSGAAAMKWGMLLLIIVVLAQAAPNAVNTFLSMPVPSSDALAIALAIGYFALAFYGKKSIDRDFFERPEAPERLPPRRRVAPPAPPLPQSPSSPHASHDAQGSGMRDLEQGDENAGP